MTKRRKKRIRRNNVAKSLAQKKRMSSASGLAMAMAELRKSKPRPFVKRYGSNGTEEQRRVHKQEESVWNSSYRKLAVAQKRALKEENARFREENK